MAQKQLMNEFRRLTLALEEIDKAQTKGTAEDAQVLREFRVKQNAVRAIRSPYLIPLTAEQRNYKALREKLKINDKRTDFQLLEAEEYKSPRDLVSVLVANNDATKATVKKLFEKQYEFKWHTETEEPDPFSFYGFCKDVVKARARAGAEGEDVMTYNTRRAHVISRLYHAQKELLKIRHVPYQELCPPVYVRTIVQCKLPEHTIVHTHHDDVFTLQWQKWTPVFDCQNKTLKKTDDKTNIDWITNDELKNYINGHSKLADDETAKDGTGQLPNEVGHLYWAVLEEDDYDKDRKRSETRPFRRIQVYVGQAKNGIKERWTGGGTSHCMKMEFARDVMCDMLSYDPTALRFEQLVDLRLLLHKACNQDGENSGLFIMGQFTKTVTVKKKEKIIGDKTKLNDAETNNINGYAYSGGNPPIIDNYWTSKRMYYGMNYDSVREKTT